jgi:predicted DNA-binding antitoxin AbrB/MazE fold protein
MICREHGFVRMVVSMTQALDAVFENGKFCLLGKPKIPLRDGQLVRLTVETAALPEDVLELAEQVYAGLSEEQVADVERISLDRRAFGWV